MTEAKSLAGVHTYINYGQNTQLNKVLNQSKKSFCFGIEKYITKGRNLMQSKAEGLSFLRKKKEEEHIKEVIEGRDK